MIENWGTTESHPLQNISALSLIFFYAQEGGPDDEDEEDLALEPQEDCCPGGPWLTQLDGWLQ